MRDYLDSIKIDENGDFDLESLSTCGTRPIISILQGATFLLEENDNKEAAIHLIDTALEKAKDFDACIERLVKEHIEKK